MFFFSQCRGGGVGFGFWILPLSHSLSMWGGCLALCSNNFYLYFSLSLSVGLFHHHSISISFCLSFGVSSCFLPLENLKNARSFCFVFGFGGECKSNFMWSGARGGDITHLAASLQSVSASPLCRRANLRGIVGDSEPSPQISYSHHTHTNTQRVDFSCPAACLCKTVSSGPRALCPSPLSPKDAKDIKFPESLN